MDFDLPEELRLTDDQVRDIIERAARMPTRADITLHELRQIARELDIDSAALDQALRDVLGATQPTQRPIRRWLRLKLDSLGSAVGRLLPARHRGVASALIGGFLGWISAFAGSWAPLLIGSIYIPRGGTALIDIPVAAALIGMTLLNSLSRRVDGRFTRYVLETLAMWLVFGFVWSVVHGAVTNDIALWTLLCVATSTVWGWFFVRRNRDDHDQALTASTPTELPAPDDTEPLDAPDSPQLWRGLVSPTFLRLLPVR